MEKLIYDEEKRSVAMPMAMRRLVSRIARHQRLIDLDAPEVILRNDLALVTNASVEFMAWVNDNVVQPSRQRQQELAEIRYCTDLAQHLRDYHKVIASPTLGDETLHRMHDEACGHPGSECDAWIIGAEAEGDE